MNLLYRIRFWWLAYMTNYFYKDHSLDPPNGNVLLYENFKDNKFHYDWGRPPWDTWGGAIFKDSQVKIQDNILVLTTDRNITPGEPGVMSGEVTAAKFLNRTYGFYECCMKPCGEWDAFWLWTSNKPGGIKYEIDIMEMECNTNNAFTITIHDHGIDGNSGSALGTKKFTLKKSLTNNYHVWGCNWRPDGISFYLDGILLWVYTGKIPDTDCFLWVNNQYKGGQLPVLNHVKQIRVQN
jgi:beta-glucanase (GH16 family)